MNMQGQFQMPYEEEPPLENTPSRNQDRSPLLALFGKPTVLEMKGGINYLGVLTGYDGVLLSLSPYISFNDKFPNFCEIENFHPSDIPYTQLDLEVEKNIETDFENDYQQNIIDNVWSGDPTNKEEFRAYYILDKLNGGIEETGDLLVTKLGEIGEIRHAKFEEIKIFDVNHGSLLKKCYGKSNSIYDKLTYNKRKEIIERYKEIYRSANLP